MILWKRWSSMVKNIVLCQNLWIFDLLWGKTITIFQKPWNFALLFIFTLSTTEKYGTIPKPMVHVLYRKLWTLIYYKTYGNILNIVFYSTQIYYSLVLLGSLVLILSWSSTRPQILVYKIMLKNPFTEMNKWFSFGITYVLTIIIFFNHSTTEYVQLLMEIENKNWFQ